ncbi:MAG: PAS domain S-box protein [Okeania sp. SIO3B3]|nr:PAS domain S-box protein [Okeania sp. SIO3B3]
MMDSNFAIVRLFSIEKDEGGTPIWLDTIASWPKDLPANPVGARSDLRDFPIAQGLITGETHVLYVEDIADYAEKDPMLHMAFQYLGFAAGIYVALLPGKDWVGLFGVFWAEPHRFTAEEKAICDGLGVLLGPAVVARQALLEQARLQQELITVQQIAIAELNYLQTLVQETDLIVCTVDGQGNFVSLNPAGERAWGYTEAELIGQPFQIVLHPDSIEPALQVFAGWLEQRPDKVTHQNRSVNAKTGAVVDLLWNINLFYNNDGTLDKIMAVARDITELNKTVSELNSLQTLVENTHTLMCSTNAQGEFTYVNPAAAQAWGYSKEELLGQDFGMVLHPDFVESTWEAFDSWVQQELPSATYQNRTMNAKTGTFNELDWSISLFYDDAE